MSALIVILAVLILGPVVYAASILHEGIKNRDRQGKIYGILAIVYVILVYVWIFAFKCGRVF